jgi:hypothetical protein
MGPHAVERVRSDRVGVIKRRVRADDSALQYHVRADDSALQYHVRADDSALENVDRSVLPFGPSNKEPGI